MVGSRPGRYRTGTVGLSVRFAFAGVQARGANGMSACNLHCARLDHPFWCAMTQTPTDEVVVNATPSPLVISTVTPPVDAP
jgi:hypothetical protein